MTSITSPQYPIDYTGAATTNLITGELQALTGASGHDYYFIVPKATPYYEASLELVITNLDGSTRTLVKGVDYYPSHQFIGASRATAHPIYASITFLNQALRGSVALKYQTLGGEWTVDDTKIAEILGDQIHNPRVTAWEQVQDVPTIFPVVDHPWNLVDMVGMSAVVEKIQLLIDEIADSSVRFQQIIDNVNLGVEAQVDAAVTVKVNDAISNTVGSADNIVEGENNKFFTEERALDSKLTALSTAALGQIAVGDTVQISLSKLQNMINSNLTAQGVALNLKTDKKWPVTTGIAQENLNVFTISSATTSIDISLAGNHRGTVAASTSIVFNTSFVPASLPGVTNVVEFSLTLKNNNVGGYAVAWPANVKWAGGILPSRSTAAQAEDSYYFYSEDNMSTWVGSLSNKAVA